MSKTVWIDQQGPGVTNLALPLYSKWRYDFNNSQDWSNCDIAVNQLSVFFSWANFTANNNNLSTLSYYIQSGSSSQFNRVVTIPPGFYAFEDPRDTPASIKLGIPPNSINGLIWQTMYANGDYLVGPAPDYLPFFFIELQVNEAAYRVSVVSTAVPYWPGGTNPSVPGDPYYGFTNPRGMYLGGHSIGGNMWFPQLSLTPNLFPVFGIFTDPIPSAPANPGNLQFKISTGTMAPLLIAATSFIVTVNVASDPSSNRPDQVLQVPVANEVFGAQINIEPKHLQWVPCSTGPFSSLEVTFYDPQGQLLQMADPQNFLSFMVRDHNDDGFITGTTNVRKRKRNDGSSQA